jgi:hypothetical protein
MAAQELCADEAWVLFRLSTAPIRTEVDGDLHCIALMDVATGILLGIEMVPCELQDPIGSAAQALLEAAREKGHSTSRILLPTSGASARVSMLARSLRMQVDEIADADLADLLDEPRASFAKRFGGPLQ